MQAIVALDFGFAVVDGNVAFSIDSFAGAGDVYFTASDADTLGCSKETIRLTVGSDFAVADGNVASVDAVAQGAGGGHFATIDSDTAVTVPGVGVDAVAAACSGDFAVVDSDVSVTGKDTMIFANG